MIITELYSRNKRREAGEEPDVYEYTKAPDKLRGQIHHIWNTAIGPFHAPHGWGMSGPPPHNNDAWYFIRDRLCRELGQQTLANEKNPKEDCVAYLYREEDVDLWLDLVQISFRYLEFVLAKKRPAELRELGIEQEAADAIEELNFRLKEVGFGYRFEAGKIMRNDSEVLHTSVVRPALQFLSDRRFAGANQEFLSAHEHYRAGENKDAVVDALNAFESTMKAICDIKGWPYVKGARASDLLRILRTNNLFPNYLDRSFEQLVATLQSGLPEVRNQEGSHGQGAVPKETPDFVAAYALHLTGANIVFLVNAMKATEVQE